MADKSVTNQRPAITSRYLLQTRRFLVLAVAAGAVAALLVLFGIWPQVTTALELNTELQAQNRTVESLEDKARQLEQVTSPELLENIETVNALLPSKKPLLELLNSLNVVAGQTGVTYTGLELTPGSIATDSASLGDSGATRRPSLATGNSSDADTLEVKLRVQGSLEQLNQFFSLVERTAPISTITALSLTPQGRAAIFSDGQNEVVPNSYEAEVTINTAYFTRPVAAAINAALPTITSDQEQFLNDIAQFTIETLPEQQGIVGGGINDLFGVSQPPTGVAN